jgi:hypothetical protein
MPFVRGVGQCTSAPKFGDFRLPDFAVSFQSRAIGVGHIRTAVARPSPLVADAPFLL